VIATCPESPCRPPPGLSAGRRNRRLAGRTRWVIDIEAGGAVDGDPAADDVFVGPAVRHAGVEAAEDVEVVVEDGEAADGDGEVLREDFEPGPRSRPCGASRPRRRERPA